MVLPAHLVDEPLGPSFAVDPGFPGEDGVPDGWIVTHKDTGLWVWTGGVMCLERAKHLIMCRLESEASQETPSE